MLCHVEFQFLLVCFLGGIPAGLFEERVVVVWEVFGVGVADFPVGGEACVCLCKFVSK